MKLRTKILWWRAYIVFKISHMFHKLADMTLRRSCDLLFMYRAACDNENVDAVVSGWRKEREDE